MTTCRYCGQELCFVGELQKEHYFNCTFCEMVFPLSETCTDRKRKMSVPKYIDSDLFYLTTAKFLERDTITLYFVLKEIRAFWYNTKTLLENVKKTIENDGLTNAKEDTPKKELMKEMRSEFVVLTKKKFVVENIILERTGFLPERITEDFLTNLVEDGENASQKPMYIYLK